MDTTKTPAEIESAMLGALMDSPRQVIELFDAAKANHEIFSQPHAGKVYLAIREMDIAGAPIEPLTVVEHLRTQGRLDEIGGFAAIEAMSAACTTAAHAEYYLAIMLERHLRAMMLRELDRAKFAIQSPGECAEIVRGKIEASFSALGGARGDLGKTPAQLLADQGAMYSRAIQGGCAGIRSGFGFWDEYFGGLQNRVYYVVSGPPGCFKTTLTRNIVEYVAGAQGLRVDFASLEQSAGQIWSSIAARAAGVRVSRLAAGKSADELAQWERACQDVSKWPIHICDEALTDATLWSWARKAKAKGSRLLVLDYLQFVRASEQRCSEEQRMARVSDAVRRIALELDIPFIAISAETKGDSKTGSGPSLRHSAQIEYDAWCWVRMRKDEDEIGQVKGAVVAIKKNRFGPQAPEFAMDHKCGGMVELARVRED